MGVLSGSIRVRRYEVLGEPAAGFQTGFEEAIQRHAFADFGAGDEREEVLGWVPVDDWFDPDLYLDRWLVEGTVALTLRIDTKRIPSRYFKQQCRKLEAEWRLKAGREDLTRAERDEIQAIVRRQLLERVIPSCKGIDMAWDLGRRQVLLWSTSDMVAEVFRTLFERTFGFKLRPLFPYLLAQRLLGSDAEEVLSRVVPTPFHPEGGA